MQDVDVPITVVCDVVVVGLAEPVRFTRSLKVHMFKPSEKFWALVKRESMKKNILVSDESALTESQSPCS